MPEIAIIGLVGAIVTFIAVNLNLYWVHRSFQSPSLRTLNQNLTKVGRFWSLEQGCLLDISSSPGLDEAQRQDYQKAARSAFVFGTLLIFLSWFGFLLFLLYALSTHQFAKSRLEQRIFTSDLVKIENLDHNRISQLLLEMENLG